MVWIFVLMTIAVYSFVMMYVLKKLQKPSQSVNRLIKKSENHQTAHLIPVHITR